MAFDLPPVSELPSEPGCPDVIPGRYSALNKSPCEVYQCPHAARCKADRLACKSFASWVSRSFGRKARPPTEPSREIFDKVYNGDDDE